MTTEVLLVLHDYQPPIPTIQIPEVLKRIIQNTYLPFAKAIAELHDAKVVLNMNGCLTNMLVEESPDTISFLGKAMEKGVLELLDSGIFHPILPFVEDDRNEFEAHVLANREANANAFGLKKQPIGFWPPELAVSTTTVKILADMGYKAIMCPANILRERKQRTLYGVKSGKNSALLLSRDHGVSNNLAFRRYGDDVDRAAYDICKTADWSGVPVIISLDGESFGEHHRGYMPFLFRLLNHKSLKWIGISDIVSNKYHVDFVDEVCSTSWSTEDADLNKGIGYSLWNHPQNPLHKIQKSHTDFVRMCLKLAGGVNSLGANEKKNYMIACISCYNWWANTGYCWSPPMVIKGFEAQMRSLKEITSTFDKKQRNAFLDYSELLYNQLKETVRTR